MGWGLGLAELGNKAFFDQLELELGLNLSLKDFPGGSGGVDQKQKYSSAQLGPELGNKDFLAPPFMCEDHQGSFGSMPELP